MYFDQEVFGKRVREARKKRRLSQEEMAEMLNISTNHYGHIEQGTRGCSIDLLLEMTDILLVSTDYLLFGRISERESEIKQLKDISEKLTNLIRQMS